MRLPQKKRTLQTIHRVALQPTLESEEANDAFKGVRLNATHFDRTVADSEIGLHDGKVRYLFLRNALSARMVDRTTEYLRTIRFSESNHTRKSLGKHGKSIGGGGTARGWMDNRLLKPSEQFAYFDQWLIMPLIFEMSDCLRQYLPEEWSAQVEKARKNGHRMLGHEPGQHPDLPSLYDHNPIFSTITVNKNVVFTSHADAGNETGLSCIATFGRFTGGHLCLPRLRVAFNIKPGDLFIGDANHEQHGSISPLGGTRVSVVAYLRGMK